MVHRNRNESRTDKWCLGRSFVTILIGVTLVASISAPTGKIQLKAMAQQQQEQNNYTNSAMNNATGAVVANSLSQQEKMARDTSDALANVSTHIPGFDPFNPYANETNSGANDPFDPFSNGNNK